MISTYFRRSLLGWLFVSGGALLLVSEVPSYAQSQQRQAADRLISEITPPVSRAPFIDRKATPKIMVSEETPPPSVEPGGPEILVETIKLSGSTRFSQEELAPYFSQVLGRQVTLQDLKKAAYEITKHYRAQGYITSRAYVPAQTFERGTVEIKVIEGALGEIFVQNNEYFSEEQYAETFESSKKQVFRYQDLENNIYYINEKPDRKARAYVIEGLEPLTSDVIIRVEEERPVHTAYEYANRGTKYTHRARHMAHVADNNFAGQGGMLNTSVIQSEEGALSSVLASYNHPFDRTKTTLHASGNYSKSMLAKHLKSAEIKGRAFTASAGVTQRVKSSAALNVDAYGGLEVKNSETQIDDERYSYDKMRVVVAGPRVLYREPSGAQTYAAVDGHWGIADFLGGSEDQDEYASQNGAGGDFFYVTANVTRAQVVENFFYVMLRAAGQYSYDTLTSVERFRLGGAYSVRGYPETDSTGDYGYFASLELEMPMFPGLRPISRAEGEESAEGEDDEAEESRAFRAGLYDFMRKQRMAVFVDAGKAYQIKRPTFDTAKDRFLLGAGAGARLHLWGDSQVNLDWTYPLGDPSTDKDRPQIHYSLTQNF